LAAHIDAARAEPPAREKTAGGVRGKKLHPRPLPIAASLVPGLILHGAGHFAAGERDVARRLLLLEGVGLGMIGAGGAYLIATGATRHYIGPPIALALSGIGLFGVSWLADVYGVVGGSHEAAGSPASGSALGPPIDVEAGYGYVYDPRFAYRQFAVVGGSARLGAIRIAPLAWLALDDDNQRFRLESAYRWAGAHSARPTGDASTVELAAALTYHRYPDDGFAVSTGEAMVSGRLDLARIGGSLAGSFAELALGIGSEIINYYRPGAGADIGELLLARFAYGVFLNLPGGLAGETSLYYDHRRDTFTGGLSPGAGPGSGFAGFFGAGLLLYIGPRWGIRAELEQGAARVAHLALLMRLGGESR